MGDVYIQIDGDKNVVGMFARPQTSFQTYKVDSALFEGKEKPYRYNPQTGAVTTSVVGLQEVKKRRVNEIHLARSAEPYAYKGKEYQADSTAVENLKAGLLAVLSGKETIDWTAADNTRRTFTAAEFREMCTGIFDRGQALFVKKVTKKKAIEAISKESDILAYDPEADWD